LKGNTLSQHIALAILAGTLFIKHFLADGPLQTKYQVKNKSKLFHTGGLSHAAIHAGLTATCLTFWFWVFASDVPAQLKLVLIVCLLEFVVHYIIDLSKARLSSSLRDTRQVEGENGQTNLLIVSDRFFILFLADQMLHSLTYVVIVFTIASQL